MFEQHIDRVFIDLMDRIAFGGGYAYISDIVGMAPVARPWRAYLLAEVDWWVYEQQISRRGDQNFDFEHEEFVYAFQHLDSLYASKARFTNDNMSKIMKTAVKTRLNMLLRPRTTLKWFVFRGEPTKPYREIILRLNYLNDYKYISDGFVTLVEKNQFLRSSNDIMSVNEFEKIIDEVDNEKIFNVTPQEFLEMVEPVFGFFNDELAPAETDTIPTAAMAIFFDDKGIFVLSKKLKQAIKNGETEISRRYLADFIYSCIEDSDRPDYTPETALPIASAAGFSLADELARFNQAQGEASELPNFGLGTMPESFFPKPIAEETESGTEIGEQDTEPLETCEDDLEGDYTPDTEPDESLDIEDANEIHSIQMESTVQYENEPDADGLEILESEYPAGADEYLLGELTEPAESESQPFGNTSDVADESFGTGSGSDNSSVDELVSAMATGEEISAEDQLDALIDSYGQAPTVTIEHPEEVDSSVLTQPDTDTTSTEMVESTLPIQAEEAINRSDDTIGDDADLSSLLAQFSSLGFGDAAPAPPAATPEEKLSMIMETLAESVDPEEMKREDERRKLHDSMKEATEDKILEMNNAASAYDYLNMPTTDAGDDSGFIVFDDEISEDLLNIAFKKKDTK